MDNQRYTKGVIFACFTKCVDTRYSTDLYFWVARRMYVDGEKTISLCSNAIHLFITSQLKGTPPHTKKTEKDSQSIDSLHGPMNVV